MSMREDKAPREFRGPKKFIKKGLIIVLTGDGKGKSTSAFGTAFRSLGRGYKVAIVQFIKGNWKTGEERAFKKFKDQCQIWSMGKGFTWETKNFSDDVATAQNAWKKCSEFLHDEHHHLVIFDEINYVIKYNFLDLDTVIRELKKKPAFKHVILTGRDAHRELIHLADLVSEVKCVKHPFNQGILAQPGIEY